MGLGMGMLVDGGKVDLKVDVGSGEGRIEIVVCVCVVG
jgi:hypothetical protein